MSLPPIKAQNKVKHKDSPKELGSLPSRVNRSKNEILVKSERGSEKRVLKSELSLPKLLVKKERSYKAY